MLPDDTEKSASPPVGPSPTIVELSPTLQSLDDSSHLVPPSFAYPGEAQGRVALQDIASVEPSKPFNYDAVPAQGEIAAHHENTDLYRSENIERFVDSLPGAQEGESWDTMQDLQKRAYDLKYDLHANPEDVMGAEKAMIEAAERLDNDHLKHWLPRQVTEILLDPGLLVKSRGTERSTGNHKTTTDADILDSITNTIREGNMEAIYKALERREAMLKRERDRISTDLERGFRMVSPGEYYQPGDAASNRTSSHEAAYAQGSVILESDRAHRDKLEGDIYGNQKTQLILRQRGLVPTSKNRNPSEYDVIPLAKPWSQIVQEHNAARSVTAPTT